MWNRYRYPSDTVLWHGEVTWEDYRVMVERIIRQYFTRPNYFTIDGKPVFSIFSFGDLVNSFGGLEGTRKALEYLRRSAMDEGLPGIHIQIISRRPVGRSGLIAEEEAMGMDLGEIIEYLDINSMTTYNWRMSGISEDYIRWAENGIAARNLWDSLLSIPYFPWFPSAGITLPGMRDWVRSPWSISGTPRRVSRPACSRPGNPWSGIPDSQRSSISTPGTNGWKELTWNRI